MDRLLPLLRSFLVAHGEALLVRHVARKLADTIEHHVPLGGATTIHAVMEMITWQEQIRLAQCSSACNAVVCALFGSEASPLVCRPTQMHGVSHSKIARHARHLRLDCRDFSSVSEYTMMRLRSMPLLRFLTLAEWRAEDSELLVFLSRRPPPELLQAIRIEECSTIDAQAMECCRMLPSLHTLSLVHCTINGDKVLEALPDFKHLSTLVLNISSDSHVHSDALLHIARVNTLRRLHLNLLLAPRGFIRPIVDPLFCGGLFTAHIEHLSLCYIDFGSARSSSILVHAFSGLNSLRTLELGWATPIGTILTAISKLPLLHALAIGDDNIQLVESTILADVYRAPKLRDIFLYGFVGVPIERFRALSKEVDTRATKYHPLSLRYLGAMRDESLIHLDSFRWSC